MELHTQREQLLVKSKPVDTKTSNLPCLGLHFWVTGVWKSCYTTVTWKVITIGHCRDIKTGVYMYVSTGRKIEDHCGQVAIISGLTVALICGKIDLKINGSVVKCCVANTTLGVLGSCCSINITSILWNKRETVTTQNNDFIDITDEI